jgi:glutamate 5-kinase
MTSPTPPQPPTPDPLRASHLSAVRSVVIKLGSQLLSTKDRRLDTAYLATIAAQVKALRDRGLRVTIVSSGAVAAGLAELNLPSRPTDLARLQAVAATGQPRLMNAWSAAFAPHALTVAQILLTYEDIEHRSRFLNLRNTLTALHDLGAVPIINENDTVSTAEIARITFGDNDILASLVATAIRAELLILLSNVDGLLDAAGQPVRTIHSLDHAASLVRKEKSALGKGGMDSKLQAARRLTASGDCLIVAHGRTPDILPLLLAAHPHGSFFPPATSPGRTKVSSRTRWIGAKRPTGTIQVDAGAARAITKNNKSLLPAGILASSVTGDFDRGALISVLDPDHQTIALGLTNYSAQDIRLIAGKKTAEVRTLLGPAAYDEVIHRDNLLPKAPSPTDNPST